MKIFKYKVFVLNAWLDADFLDVQSLIIKLCALCIQFVEKFKEKYFVFQNFVQIRFLKKKIESVFKIFLAVVSKKSTFLRWFDV